MSVVLMAERKESYLVEKTEYELVVLMAERLEFSLVVRMVA